MSDNKIWYISWRKEGQEICDTKLCSRNYITAAAYARREAKSFDVRPDRIVMETSDSFKLYVIDL